MPDETINQSDPEKLAPIFPTFEAGKLVEFQVSEPYPFFNSVVPPLTISIAPSFVNLTSVSIPISRPQTQVWVNGTVGWFSSFTAVGTIDAVFQLLKGSQVVYETRQSINSPTAVPAPPLVVYTVAHIEYVDATPAAFPTTITYTLRVQANVAGGYVGGPVTLTAAELERS